LTLKNAEKIYGLNKETINIKDTQEMKDGTTEKRGRRNVNIKHNN